LPEVGGSAGWWANVYLNSGPAFNRNMRVTACVSHKLTTRDGFV